MTVNVILLVVSSVKTVVLKRKVVLKQLKLSLRVLLCLVYLFSSEFEQMVEIKMSTTEQSKTQETIQTDMAAPDHVSMNMESVNRVAKLPVVEATINAASSLYERAKESNSMINYALSTAESTVKSGVEKMTPVVQPVTSRLEGPMKKVDEMLCTGLDYVETKVPCVKLPPGEMLENTKNYISETVQPAVQSARNVVEPAVQTARNVVEPAVQTAKDMVEPAMHTAAAVKDYGLQKVEELVKGKRSEASADGAEEPAHTCERHAKK